MTTPVAKIADSRGSVSLTKETSEKLKIFSRKNGLKMYEVIDSMVDVANNNEEFAKEIVRLTKSRSKDKDTNKQLFSKKLNALPSALKDKIKSMSADELAALLEKAGL